MNQSMNLFAIGDATTSPADGVAVVAADVDWWARGLSAASFLVAVAAFTLAWRTYQRSGSRVRILAPGKLRRFSIYRLHEGIWLDAVIRNRGLAPIQVESARWIVDEHDDHKPLLRRGQHRLRENVVGAAEDPSRLPDIFPVTLEGQHAFHWLTMPPSWEPEETGKSAYRMRLLVEFGDGRRAKSPWVIINNGVDWDYIKSLARPRRLT